MLTYVASLTLWWPLCWPKLGLYRYMLTLCWPYDDNRLFLCWSLRDGAMLALYRRNSRISFFRHACPKREIGNLLFIPSRLTYKCATHKLKDICNSSLWTRSHHMVILKTNHKNTDFWMILALLCRFKSLFYFIVLSPLLKFSLIKSFFSIL